MKALLFLVIPTFLLAAESILEFVLNWISAMTTNQFLNILIVAIISLLVYALIKKEYEVR